MYYLLLYHNVFHIISSCLISTISVEAAQSNMSRSSLKNFSVRKTLKIFTMRQRRTRRRKAKFRLLPLVSSLASLKARKFKRFSKIEKTTRLR